MVIPRHLPAMRISALLLPQFNMIKSKSGLSIVIATVLMILVTIVAAGIIAGFVVPFVRDNLEGSTACLDYIDYFGFEEKFVVGGAEYRYNCFDSTSNNSGVSVKTKSVSGDIAKNIAGFELIFNNEEGSEKVSVRNGETNSKIWNLGAENKELEVPQPGEKMSYVYDGGKRFSSVDIAPVLKSGKICEKTDSITIINCKSNVVLN